MTTKQREILELIATLPLSERRALFDRATQAGLLDAAIHSNLSAEQQAELRQSMAEADRGDVVSEDEMFARLENQFGVKLG